MITKFSKGFYGKPREHAAFIRAVKEGDCSEILSTIALSGSQRPFTDPFVNAMPRRAAASNALLNMALEPNPEPDSAEHLDEMDIVYKLAELRDLPLDDIAKEIDLPRGYTELSPFLEDVRVPKYAPGHDYGMDEKEWQDIQRGMFMGEQLTDGKTKIKTGRDSAAYVKGDHFLKIWLDVLHIIVMEGVELKEPDRMDIPTVSDGGGFENFAIYGEPFWAGVLGEVLRVVGHVSFYKKWELLFPRPEEGGHFYGMGHLPLAYAEGSPMHCARNAMHSAAALALAYAIQLMVKDPNTRLNFTGASITDSTNLLADNTGYFRVTAGVHYPSDHDSFRMIAKAVAEDVVSTYLRAR